MLNIRQSLGILRSYIIYYAKPFNSRKLKEHYSQFIKKGDLCFDVGAHLGNRVDAWLGLGARTLAVEPQPRCIGFLTKRFGKNPNFTLVQKAVGDKPGKVPFYISSLTPTISTLSGAEWRDTIQEKTSFSVKWDEELEVEVVTLDQLIQEYGTPAFMKIDVEDFELEALKGLSVPVPALSFEYLAAMAHRTLECIEVLEGLGSYTYNWSLGETLNLQADPWLSAKEIKEFLGGLTFEDRSGDIYARLEN